MASRESLTLPGGSAAYLPGDAAEAETVAGQIEANEELNPQFRSKLASLVREMFQLHAIVLRAPGNGLRRSFKTQMTVDSLAGPGESNHQYGLAADLGFQGLQWLDGGRVRKDNYWLDARPGGRPAMLAGAAAAFWRARDEIALRLGLFRTAAPGDLIHLQAHPDSEVCYGRSLARLLTISGKLRWDCVAGKPNRYRTDFGLGFDTPMYIAGTARQIFSGQATVPEAALRRARELPASALRKAAKIDWEAAAANWRAWKPVP